MIEPHAQRLHRRRDGGVGVAQGSVAMGQDLPCRPLGLLPPMGGGGELGVVEDAPEILRMGRTEDLSAQREGLPIDRIGPVVVSLQIRTAA